MLDTALLASIAQQMAYSVRTISKDWELQHSFGEHEILEAVERNRFLCPRKVGVAEERFRTSRTFAGAYSHAGVL